MVDFVGGHSEKVQYFLPVVSKAIHIRRTYLINSISVNLLLERGLGGPVSTAASRNQAGCRSKITSKHRQSM